MIKNILARARAALYYPLQFLAFFGFSHASIKAFVTFTVWLDTPIRRFILRGFYEV